MSFLKTDTSRCVDLDSLLQTSVLKGRFLTTKHHGHSEMMLRTFRTVWSIAAVCRVLHLRVCLSVCGCVYVGKHMFS